MKTEGDMVMRQKLSAMNYIKNNRRRVAVLVVSLGLCFVLTYLTNFLLMSTEETFRVALVENAKKVQYLYFAGSSLGVDIDNPDYEALLEEYYEKNLELVERLKTHEGVEQVYYTHVIYNVIDAAIGNWGLEVPLVEAEELPRLLSHCEVEVCEGRMPQHPGELVLDKASMSNGDYSIGDYLDEESYGETYQIVGVLDSERYWGCGIVPEEGVLNDADRQIVVLSDGSIKDMTKLLKTEGIEVRDTYDSVVDETEGEQTLKEQVTDVISTSTDVVYIGIMVLLALALFIVYTTYLRDRYNEWCLYCSIGYSRKTIYHAILKELLFTFGVAIAGGLIIIAVSVVGVDILMFRPAGLRCRYFYPQTIFEIACSYTLLFGVLQIPVRHALYKIRTIDAMEDDLY